MPRQRNVPKIIIDPPGPKSKEMIDRERKAIGPAHAHYLPIALEEGGDYWVSDIDGNTYLDFTAGAAVMSAGIRHPKVVEAIRSHLDKYVSHSIFFATFEPLIQLTEKVKEMIPWPNLKDGKMVYGASGSEAVEIATSLARKGGRLTIISLFPSYHGRTLGANSLTGMRASFRKHANSLVTSSLHAPYPDCYRCPFKLKYPECGIACASYIDTMLSTIVDPKDVGALIMEPIGGSGGYQVPPQEYIPMVKKICEKYAIPFIADEIQSGFGRTGKMFAMEHENIPPDIVTLGKPLGGGLPIGGCLAPKELMDSWEPGAWGSTFAGNMLSSVAGIATLDIITKERLHENAAKMGKLLMNGLKEIAQTNSAIGDVRGRGLMLAVEFVKDRDTKEPAADIAKQVVNLAMKKGLLVSTAGTFGNCVRMIPPLIIDEYASNKAIEIMADAVKEAAS
jgi:4-aminobutyrate aminotransferase